MLVIGIGFFMINLVIMQNLEKYLIRDRKIDYQKFSIQLAQLIADDYYNKDPNIFYRIQEFGYEVVQMEGESTRILILNRNGIVEQDSYQSTSLLRRDLTQDYPDVVSVLKGNSVRARDVTIKAGNPPERSNRYGISVHVPGQCGNGSGGYPKNHYSFYDCHYEFHHFDQFCSFRIDYPSHQGNDCQYYPNEQGISESKGEHYRQRGVPTDGRSV